MNDILKDDIEVDEAKLFAPNDHNGFGTTTDHMTKHSASRLEDGSSYPILFTAPHAIVQWREGERKEQDDYTGAIALTLAGLTGGHALAMSGNPTGDPMKPTTTDSKGDDHPFKKEIMKYKADQGVRLVFDLHGIGTKTAEENKCDIGLGLGSLPNTGSGVLARAIKKTGEKLDLQVKVGFKAFAALQRSTVTTFCTAKGLYAIQVEMAPCLRFGPDEEKRIKLLQLLATVALDMLPLLNTLDQLNDWTSTCHPARYFSNSALMPGQVKVPSGDQRLGLQADISTAIARCDSKIPDL